MRNKFDMQLDSLKEQLTNMGELCEVAITKATEAILEGKEEQAREVILADEEIDQAEKDIERLCLKLLLQQQPVAFLTEYLGIGRDAMCFPISMVSPFFTSMVFSLMP